MFDFVERNRKFVQILLGLVILALAIGVGLGGYNAFSEPYLVKVGNTKITEKDIVEVAGRENLSNEQRVQLISQLVQRQLMLNKADDLYLEASEQILEDTIKNTPSFMENGKFNPERYEAFLSTHQKTSLQYQKELARAIRSRQLVLPLIDSSFISQTVLKKLMALLSEKREVSVAHFLPQTMLSKVQLDNAEMKKYYDQHKKDFLLPKQVRVEYIVLAKESLAHTITVSEKEVSEYQKSDQANGEEERRARHILLPLPKGANDRTIAKLKNDAAKMLAELKANPKKFASFAMRYSQDPGSAKTGGDLGFLKRGMTVPTFENALFSLKPGEMSGLVETPFGVHIIQLEEIRAPKSLSKSDATLAVKKQKANHLFMSEQTKLNEALSMAKDLNTVAIKFHLAPQKSDWLSYNTAKDSILNHANVRSAIFSDEVLNGGYNTELIEIQPDVLVAARVVEKKAERQQTFEEVRGLIAAQLREEKALKLSIEMGKKALLTLEKGGSINLTWSGKQVIDRLMQTIQDGAERKIFTFTQSALPAYVGVELPNGYMIYRVDRILPPSMDPNRQKAIETYLLQSYGQKNLEGYLQSLQKQTNIEISPTIAR